MCHVDLQQRSNTKLEGGESNWLFSLALMLMFAVASDVTTYGSALGSLIPTTAGYFKDYL